MKRVPKKLRGELGPVAEQPDQPLVLVARHRGEGDGSSGVGEGPFFSRPPRSATLATTPMRAATALPEPPLEGQKLALRRSDFPRELASAVSALQPANTNRENPCAYDGSASESCNWTSKDPWRFKGNSLNIYVYGGNDPVDHVDLTGLDYNSFDFDGCMKDCLTTVAQTVGPATGATGLYGRLICGLVRRICG